MVVEPRDVGSDWVVAWRCPLARGLGRLLTKEGTERGSLQNTPPIAWGLCITAAWMSDRLRKSEEFNPWAMTKIKLVTNVITIE